MKQSVIDSDNQNIGLALLKNLVFFDLFYYPLTAYEAWRYLPLEASFFQVRQALKLLVSQQTIATKNGFYYLIGREKTLIYRQQRYHFANRKLKIARQAATLFSYLPWVKFVALSNLIGRHNMRDGSDIDLFIIAGHGRLWLSRLFCAGLMKILGQRPTKENKRDKICLSFYVDSAHLNISELALKSKDDWYFYYWLAGLYPLYDEGGYHFRLMKNNQWLKDYLPNIDFLLSNQAYTPSLKFRPKSHITSRFIKNILDKLEAWSQAWQWKIMPSALKDLANLDSQVVVQSGIIKLYLIDRRQEFRQRYHKHLAEVLES